MRQFLAAFVFVLALSPITHAAPGAVRCGKLLDVRTGQMLADLIAVNGDPASDVRVLESVKFVLKGGTVVRNDLGAK